MQADRDVTRALVHAFMEQKPKTRAFMRACGWLLEGSPTAKQPDTVRPHLRELTRHGYVFSLDNRVWFLTDLGHAAREAYEAFEVAREEAS